MLNKTEKQINECLNILNKILKNDLLGVYLYGSSTLGGLQKYSDIDLFVVTARTTSHEEKAALVTELLKISGVYMKSKKLPIEITIVEKSEINPWHYPPHFDFQYGEWLRDEFENNNIEPWSNKEMPDLALLITQVILASKTLFGLSPNQLLCPVPYFDVILATKTEIKNLIGELDTDTRNVILRYARIWSRLETDSIHSKSSAADWAIDHLPEKYHHVIKRAKAIYKGEEKEYWDDIFEHVKSCADFMVKQINNKITDLEVSGDTNRSIRIA